MGKIIYKGIGYGGGGNSNTGDFVDVDLIQVTGTKIATININNEPNDLYAPGGVSDVKVNNVSVLSGDVAEIDLTDYATSSDLDGKQDSLTPGTNITIDQNNVISATGGNEVEANPQGTATDTLNTVDIDGTIYTIEGTPVEANPAGAATADLTKIGINNIIYDLATGNTDYTELTQAQYNALTPAQKNNGTLYFITDAIAGGDGDVAAELLTETEYAALTTEQKTNGLIYFVKEDAGSSSTVRKIYYMNLEFGSTGGGGGGNVADVYVNGTSALDSNHIAQVKTHRVLTQDAYNALSISEKNNGTIYFIQSGGSISDYTFVVSQDETCIVRINNTTQESLWFWCGFNNEYGDAAPPTELAQYVPDTLVMTSNYPSGGTIQNGWVGFYNSNIRSWDQSTGYIVTGLMYGVLDLNDPTSQQVRPYFNPYEIADSITSIYYMSNKYTKNNIEELDNVNITNLANGQILKYNSTSQKWENANESGGGSGNVADVYVNGVSVLDANDIAQIKTHKILTQTAYDNLSQAEKDDDIIYFIQPSSFSNYEFHESLDGTCIVRINETENEHLWFFKNFYNEYGDVAPPAELSEYVPSTLVLTPNYPNGGSIQDGWVGFYNNNVRSWTQNKQSLTTGYFYGVIDLDDTTQEQSIPYFDPYDIGSREYKIYYKGIEYTKNNIENLANVNVSSVANGQILKYNSTTQKWENANESGGGGIDNYYLRNGIIAKASPAAYTSCLLDKPMDNGDYKYIINDNNTETTGFFTWEGSTLNLSLSGKTLQITATTAGLTYYSGNWRDITCDIKRLDGAVIDENVLQTATNLDANYEVLFSESADNTTKTEGARKSNLLIFNPSTGRLQSTQFYCLNGYSNCILKGDSLYFGGNSSLETELTKSGLEVSYGNNRTMQVVYNDINLVGGIDTWDGTNTSLKTALQDILNRLTTLEGGNV